MFQQRYAKLFKILILNFLDQLVAVEHAKDAIQRFNIIDCNVGRVDSILRAKMLFRLADLTDHLHAGKAAATNRKR
ncbi:hypothetical protein SDC9_144826 [bioreactor metagenome]|uniref:Uncharacterized protein n=1 Tax=bioreactor metagenome TaxID=1076179 RepID=A0A645E8B1_9ZZZZ